jgi:hypothetical protein
MLTPLSGSAGNVVTVFFEPSAMLTAPYWGGASAGAISISSKSYITIDGGTNGIIKNTANGTALANQQASQGIYISSSDHIEIKNLTISDIYANGGSDPNATDTGGVNTNNIVLNGDCNNISIHNNVLSGSRSGVRVNFDGSTIDTISMYQNTISDHCWGIMMGGGNGGEEATNVNIYNNEITDWLNWQCPANASFCTNKTDVYHTDGIILYQRRGNAVIFEPKIYNNYIHGDLGGGSPTAYIYCTHGGGTGDTSTSCTIFNNLLVNDGSHNTWLLSTGGATSGHKIYNNTLVGRSSAGGTAMMLSGTDITVKNNIVTTVRLGIGSYDTTTSVISVSDKNVWYNINTGPTSSMFNSNDGGTWYNWAQWQALGYDGNSTTSDPLLSGTYYLTAGSSAIAAGANLTSVGITALNSDKDGLARPASGAWDIGAYEYVSPGVSAGTALGSM